MRIGLLTEGGYPFVSGDARLWCDRLVRGLEQHEFDVYALSRSRQQEDEGHVPLPPQVGRGAEASKVAAGAKQPGETKPTKPPETPEKKGPAPGKKGYAPAGSWDK